ncbi:hypothetical protein GPALN_005840 [Globodera pallida]|nr:hypothetical protein GPALN_005840 [Globodera pallida]
MAIYHDLTHEQRFERKIAEAIQENLQNDASIAIHECGHALVAWLHPEFPNKLTNSTIVAPGPYLLGVTNWRRLSRGYT